MVKISRHRRAELVRSAAAIRRNGQRTGWNVATIAEEISDRIPELKPLEVWRLAYGWSRPQVVEAMVDIYRRQGLAEPGLTSARLCRWEHDTITPDIDYVRALVEVYRVPAWRLGFVRPRSGTADWYRHPQAPGQGIVMGENTLTAVTDSVRLQREVEGPAGGPASRGHLQRALDYYAHHYSTYPPAVLAAEIHRCRAIVVDMLAYEQAEIDRKELRGLAGRLSGLLGNLAFHLADFPGAHIHLGTGARLGLDVGEPALVGWCLGAESMVCCHQNRPAEALDLARQAADHADTPLRRAQITAWCELRALARLGRIDETRQAAVRAQRHMEAARAEEHGRFGFDHRELHQHVAEAALETGDIAQAKAHATRAIDMATTGRPSWAANTVILARAHAAEHNVTDATALAARVLDATPPQSLRETTRTRLVELRDDLTAEPSPGIAVRDLWDRLRALPALVPSPRTSPEPNGH